MDSNLLLEIGMLVEIPNGIASEKEVSEWLTTCFAGAAAAGAVISAKNPLLQIQPDVKDLKWRVHKIIPLQPLKEQHA